VFGWFHLFEGLWRYVSMRDMRNTQRVPDCGMRNSEFGMTENLLASWKA